jgi:hypothetical protein
MGEMGFDTVLPEVKALGRPLSNSGSGCHTRLTGAGQRARLAPRSSGCALGPSDDLLLGRVVNQLWRMCQLLGNPVVWLPRES